MFLMTSDSNIILMKRQQDIALKERMEREKTTPDKHTLKMMNQNDVFFLN